MAVPSGDPPAPHDSIPIGEILGAHGLGGEVRLRSFAGEPASIADYSPLSDGGERRLAITALRRSGHPEIFIARIEGVRDRSAAEALAGTPLHASRQRLAPAGEDEFLHADLVGCRVERADGAVIGKVVAVQNFGAGDLVEMALTGRRATEFLPFTREFVPSVDIAGRRIVAAIDPTPRREPASAAKWL